MALEIIVFDTATLTEFTQTVKLPSVYQTGMGIVSGRTYRLSVETEIDSGILEIYQGTQLIYSSGVNLLGNLSDLHDNIVVTEKITVDVIENSVSPSASPSRSVSKSPSSSPSVSPSISASPSLSPSTP